MTTKARVRTGLTALLLAATAAAGCTNESGGAGGSSWSEDPGDTAILVLDDFNPRPPKTTGSPTDNCAGTQRDLTQMQANVIGSTGGGGGLPDGVSHGEAVYKEVVDHIPDTLIHDQQASAHSSYFTLADSWTYHASSGNYTLLVAGIDTESYTIDTVLTNLKAAINELTGKGYQRFVLNLSFVDIPCDIASWLTDAGMSTSSLLAIYQDMVANDPSGQLQSALNDLGQGGTATVDSIVNDSRLDSYTARLEVQLTYSAFDAVAADEIFDGKRADLQQRLIRLLYDPAWTAFKQDVIDRGTALRIIPVGAAGNGAVWDNGTMGYQLEFPYAPALWSSVLSVSASADAAPSGLQPSGSFSMLPSDPEGCRADDRLARYSNCAQVMADGVSSSYPGATGTSFAAPKVSVMEAIYLLSGGAPKCGDYQPPLGYGKQDLAAPPSSSQGQPLPTIQLTLKDEPDANWTQYCEEFLSRQKLRPVSAPSS